jgi:hypothetical protein
MTELLAAAISMLPPFFNSDTLACNSRRRIGAGAAILLNRPHACDLHLQCLDLRRIPALPPCEAPF